MKYSFYTVTDIGSVIESLPKEESEHMSRVGMLVSILAQKLYDLDVCQKFSCREEYKYFGRAAYFHDIGKAWVPKSILMKPATLTKGETEIVHKHPEYARKLFYQIDDNSTLGLPKHLAKLAFNSAVYHHERWNGKGYPYGLGRDNIPLIARITSICDAYDAMTNIRTYSNGNSHYHACQELELNAGTQFDPMLVQVFLDNESELSVILDKIASSF